MEHWCQEVLRQRHRYQSAAADPSDGKCKCSVPLPLQQTFQFKPCSILQKDTYISLQVAQNSCNLASLTPELNGSMILHVSNYTQLLCQQVWHGILASAKLVHHVDSPDTAVLILHL